MYRVFSSGHVVHSEPVRRLSATSRTAAAQADHNSVWRRDVASRSHFAAGHSKTYKDGLKIVDGENLPLKCRIQPRTKFHVVACNLILLLSMLVQLVQCTYGPLGVLMLLCSAGDDCSSELNSCSMSSKKNKPRKLMLLDALQS
jgi:hypothetical protein